MICAIIQARMGSTRLPGKGMIKVLDKPMIYYVIERARLTKRVDQVIVAAPDTSKDDEMCVYVNSMGVDVYRGSENDVLDRYYRAAAKFEATDVIRITADCPLIDPAVIDFAVKDYQVKGVDFNSNTSERTYPDGQDVEIFKFSALESAWKTATDPIEREHLTKPIRLSGRFTVSNFKQQAQLGDLRWTLDYPEDLEFISKVLEGLIPEKGIQFSMQDVLEFLQQNPAIEQINKKYA